MKYISLIIACVFITQFATAQKFITRWQKTIGGNSDDVMAAVQPTKDGGFIVSGYSNSSISGDKKQNANNSSNDYWVVKLSAAGVVQWSKTIGGNGDDINTKIIQTRDGGYLTGGISVSDKSVNKSVNSRDSSYDFWIVKLDATGNIQWENTVGGSFAETMMALGETSNGYIAAGSSYSNKGYDKKEDNTGNEAWADYWIVKFTSNGKIIWSKALGAENQDQLTSGVVCKDGGYLLGGFTYSVANGLKTSAHIDNSDYWIVKTDSSGKKIWDRTYGAYRSEYLTDLKQTADGGYLVGGYSNSPIHHSKTGDFIGYMDFWFLKTDGIGNILWDKTIGANKGDYLVSVQQTADKGYLLGGYSNSDNTNFKSQPSQGSYDYWVVKTDSLGNKLWDRTYGGRRNDKLAGAYEISEGEYILGGTSNSPVSGDKKSSTVGNNLHNDFWLLRVSRKTTSLNTKITEADNAITSVEKLSANDATVYNRMVMTVSPNPAKDHITLQYSNASGGSNTIHIYTNDGKTLYQQTLKSSSNTISVNVSGYAKGTYYITLSGDNKSITRKFIKE